MYIEQISIEGFKSYARHVVVTNFDGSFNAITGLNGSGKSNILDAICFVLGIKNLSHVRASNVVELIYKQGQAGVTKATVSIKFDNTDAQNMPVGYEDQEKITVTRQVVVGGREKYMINSRSVPQSKVQDLFQSVSLNVNNPHFLIMQGRITKVLNMRPPEILAMVEEAASTRMCDQKCTAARQTLAKKERKRADIDQMLETDILPCFERMKREKEQYLEWQQACSNAEQLGHIVSAYRYWKLGKLLEEEKELHKARIQELKGLEADREAYEKDIKAKGDEISRLKAQQEGESQGMLDGLKKDVDKLSLKLAKLVGAVEAGEDDQEAQLAEVKKLRADLEAISEVRLAERAAEAQARMAASQEVLDKAAKELEAAKSELAGLESGDGRDASSRSLPERLKDAEAEVAAKELEAAKSELAGLEPGDGSDVSSRSLPQHLKDAEAEVKQQAEVIKTATVTVEHLESEAAAARKIAKQKLSEDKELQAELTSKRKAVETAQKAFDAIHMDAAHVADLENTVHQRQAAVQRAKVKCRELSAGIGHVLKADYAKPHGNFDDSAIKGYLARLVHIKDEKHALALEVAAGSKLYHLVVTTDQVGAELIERKCLRKRITIVPLNKTRVNIVSQQKQGRAAAHTHGRATLALELASFDKDVTVAMQYAFGNVFICEDRNAARKVMESSDVACRAISLQGDDYSPAGTLTGGSRGNGEQLLTRLAAFADAEAELHQHEAAFAAAERKLDSLPRQKKAAATEKLEQAQHSLQLVERRTESSASHQAQAHANELDRRLQEAQAGLQAAQDLQVELRGKVEELKVTIRDFNGNRGGIIKTAKARVTKLQTGFNKATTEHAAVCAEAHECAADESSAASERVELQQQLEAAQQSHAKVSEQVANLKAEAAGIREALSQAEAALQEHRVDLERRGARVREAMMFKNELVEELAILEQEQKKATNNIKDAKKQLAELEDQQQILEKKQPWLPKVKDELGVAGGKFDFAALDMLAKEAAYKAAVEAMDSRGSRVDKSIIQKYERAEREIVSLTERQETLTRDRDTILKTLEELDIQKDRQVKAAWERINVDFGQIFSTLLPGTTAKLQPPEGGSLKDGLEVKVAFGGVWKESLSELSGGQRSLVALALVFSLLKFRPAPLYILDEESLLELSGGQRSLVALASVFSPQQFRPTPLYIFDEVDAALDLSHTANIGRMIREHFAGAQFIVVSLKEGMFTNANVIFRTRFVDGSSTVIRTLGTGHSESARKGGDSQKPAAKRACVGTAEEQENRVLQS